MRFCCGCGSIRTIARSLHRNLANRLVRDDGLTHKRTIIPISTNVCPHHSTLMVVHFYCGFESIGTIAWSLHRNLANRPVRDDAPTHKTHDHSALHPPNHSLCTRDQSPNRFTCTLFTRCAYFGSNGTLDLHGQRCAFFRSFKTVITKESTSV